jgi:phenylacetate-CoA ligase
LKIRRVLAVVNPLGKKMLIVHPSTLEGIAREGRERLKGFRWLTRQMDVSLFDDMDRHVRTVLDFQPDIINTCPSHLCELSARFREKGIPPPEIPAMFTTSEYLSENSRRSVEEAFHGRIFDVYGSTEFKEIAWQCRQGTYHVNFEHAWLEALPSENGGSSEPSLVITSLSNRAMPLLRYSIGDLGAVAWGACACGRRSPRLTGIRGRMAEMVTLPSGRRISPYVLTTTIEASPEIRRYQILQRSPEEIQVHVVAYNTPIDAAVLESLARRLRGVMKEKVRIGFEQVSQINRSRSGKFQIVRKTD